MTKLNVSLTRQDVAGEDVPLAWYITDVKTPFFARGRRKTSEMLAELDMLVTYLRQIPAQEIVDNGYSLDVKVDDDLHLYLSLLNDKPYIMSFPVPFLAVQVGIEAQDNAPAPGDDWYRVLVEESLLHYFHEGQGFVPFQEYYDRAEKESPLSKKAFETSFHAAMTVAESKGYVDSIYEVASDGYDDLAEVKPLCDPALGGEWLPS